MRKFPNAINIVLLIIVISWILTYLIPTGTYERITDESTGRIVVVGDSYTLTDSPQLSFFDMLVSIPHGIAGRADLIVLILLIGGCFYILEKTGALLVGLSKLVRMLEGKESTALVVMSLLFGLAGITIGIQEELIGMVPVILLFGRMLGYDNFTVLYMSFGSAIVGGAFSPMNPFAVLIAQGEAELPLLSAATFRLLFLAAALLVWILYLLRYARNHRTAKESLIDHTESKMSWRHSLILTLLGITFVIVTYGLIALDWDFPQMGACFFLLAIVSGIIGQLGFEGTAENYVAGFKEMIFSAVVLGLAYSISLILKDGMVIDSIIHGLFGPLENLPPAVSAFMMMIAHSILHLPVASYSGQAIMTMPILVPLSDLIGLSRQSCVLAYQYGAVMMDLVIPTNGALMAILAMCSISYDKWLKFIWKPMAIMFIISAIAVVTASVTNLS